MSSVPIEQRLSTLEQAVEQLQRQVGRGADPMRRWWVEGAGRFKGDPVFDEIVQLGKRYRDSLRPARRKAKRARS